MTDRTSELAAEFSKEIDARIHNQKTLDVLERVIDHFDTRVSTLTDIVGELLKIVGRQGDRIIELEKQVGTL